MSEAATGWNIEVVRGSASSFHGRALPDDAARHLWWFEVARPALVLGSTQRNDVVDADACSRQGVEVVRRHSGGGAVLLLPDEVVWFDLVVPRHDPLWDDDVSRAAYWVGDAVLAALEHDGAAPDLGMHVHRGPLVSTTWSSLVCFAGVGPGEVLLGDAPTTDDAPDAMSGSIVPASSKILGVSQRRTRSMARFQCAVYRAWRPEVLVDLLAEPRPTVAELAHCATPISLGLEALVQALPR